MLFRRNRVIVAALLPMSLSCASTGSTDYSWHESRFAFMPSGLIRQPVLVLPTMAVAVSPGAEGLSDTGAVARARTDSVVLATLTQRMASIPWLNPRDLRNGSGEPLPNVDSLPMHTLTLQMLHRISEPLLGQLRRLNQAAQGQFVFVPVRVTYKRAKSERNPVRVELTMMLLETQSGVVAWRSDVAAESATPSAALALAILSVTGTWRQ